MNRKFISFFSFVVMICLSVAMVSCGDDNDDPKDPSDPGQSESYGALKSIEYTYSLELKGDFDLAYNKSIKATVDGKETTDKMEGMTFTKVYDCSSVSNNNTTAEFAIVLEDNGKELPEGKEKCDFYALPKLEVKAVYEKKAVNLTFETPASATGDRWIYTKGVNMAKVLSSGKTGREAEMTNFPRKSKVSVKVEAGQFHVNFGTGILSE